MIKKIFFSLFCYLVMVQICYAVGESASLATITSVQVLGNVAVSSATILSKIKIRPGQPFSQKELDEDLKRLYATGYFTDIKIDLRETSEGMVVIFNVKERPVIESIAFDGNRIFRKEKLEKTVGSKVNDFLNPRQIKQDIDAIVRMYKDKGYNQVKVEDSVDIDPKTNYAKVKFLISEQFRARIKRVSVEGSKAYSRAKILKLVKTKTAGFFRAGVFKPEILDEDLERVKVFYQNAGYMDAEVSSSIDYDKNGRWIYVKIKIVEGRKYLVNEIELSGNTVYKAEEIKKVLKMTKGKAFSQEGYSKYSKSLF